MVPEQKLALTFASTGLTAGPHLVELRRDAFTHAGCLPYRQLWKMRNGAKVRVGGLVADGLRRPPTAKGIGFLRLDMPELPAFDFDPIQQTAVIAGVPAQPGHVGGAPPVISQGHVPFLLAPIRRNDEGPETINGHPHSVAEVATPILAPVETRTRFSRTRYLVGRGRPSLGPMNLTR